MLNTVRKIGPVLELFGPEQPEWRMTEIAKALGMPKSSAHSLLTTLAEVGLLTTTDQGRYRLGWHLLTLAERTRASLDFRRVAVPAMTELAAEGGETVFLAVLDRDRVLYVERVEGSHPTVRIAGIRVGARFYAHCTAVGKMLLAERDIDEVRELIERSGMRRTTVHTIDTLERFEEELRQIRTRGVAFDMCEAVADISCMAAPVRDRYGSVIAAMSVATPAYRFEQARARTLDLLLAATERVSAALAAGHGGGAPSPELPEPEPAALS